MGRGVRTPWSGPQVEATLSMRTPATLVFGAALLAPFLPARPAQALPAFPGAQGFGTETTGGRHGVVLVVTTLAGSGPGSFRAAMMSTQRRIIVFRVSGVIDLGGDIALSEANSYVTVLGQSSPGGVTFINGSIGNYQTNFHDAIFRFIRLRAQSGDTIAFNPVYNLVIDHSDFSGGADETFDIDASHDFTVQWSTILNSKSPPDSQNFGTLIAYKPTTNITFHHNFSAHHAGRCGAQFHWAGDGSVPADGARLDLRNNVFYNCGFQQIYRQDAPLPAGGTNYNLIGNYAKAGPNTPAGSMIFGLDGTLHMVDNKYPGHSIISIFSNPTYLPQPHPFPPVTTAPVDQAFEQVLDRTGSWPRDAMTTRTVAEARAGTGTLGQLNDPLNTTGPPPPPDADLDGIADSWELSHGLSPSNPLDSAQIHPSGYAWVEVYLNEIADQIVQPGARTLSVDDVTVAEGDAGTTAAAFTVRLSAPSASAVTVGYATANQTATAGSDYQAASGALTFAPGALTRTVSVNALGDQGVEPDETFALNLSAAVGATLSDGQGVGTIADDDAPTLALRELAHGSSLSEDLSAATGVAGQDAFRLSQSPWSSYEVVLDALSGDASPAVLERLAADNVTVLQTATGTGVGSARSLRWENASGAPVTNQHVRARGSCASACGPDDVYRIRAWETTGRIARFNNSGGQGTVLILQNPGGQPVAGRAHFWGGSGTLLATHSFTLAGRATLVLNTSALPALVGQAGSVTVTHDGGYEGLVGKAVSLEPATGFSIDSPMSPRPR
jgi:pectate lyase